MVIISTPAGIFNKSIFRPHSVNSAQLLKQSMTVVVHRVSIVARSSWLQRPLRIVKLDMRLPMLRTASLTAILSPFGNWTSELRILNWSFLGSLSSSSLRLSHITVFFCRISLSLFCTGFGRGKPATSSISSYLISLSSSRIAYRIFGFSG